MGLNNKIIKMRKRMLRLALSKCFTCNGEIYKLLSSEYIIPLLNNIKETKVRLTSDLVFGKEIVTSEEAFLENLDKYISYVRNTYFLNHNEIYLLIEMSLSNKYSSIINSLEDYHYKDNYNKYLNEFRKLFLYNIYDNIKYYSKYVSSTSIINHFLNDISKYDFDNNKDIGYIEKIFITMLNQKKDNIYNIALPYKEINTSRYDFHISQIEKMIYDYYKKSTFIINKDDKYITSSNGVVILLNIKKNNNKYDLEFGVKNNNFHFKNTYSNINKNKLDRFIYLIKNYNIKDKIKSVSFNNSLIKFSINNKNDIVFLNINIKCNNNDIYSVKLNEQDINKLTRIIN